MSAVPDFAGPLGAALDAVRRRAGLAIAAEAPADVVVSMGEDGLAISGRSLSVRAATDPRLRDFAAIVRAAR